MLKSLYKKTVLAVTSFFCGVSGAFLLSGAGSPGLNIMFALIFLVSLLNLSLYTNEYCKSFITQAASFFPPPAKPGPAKPEGPKAEGAKAEDAKAEGGKPESPKAEGGHGGGHDGGNGGGGHNGGSGSRK